MSLETWGVVLGVTTAAGLLLMLSRIVAMRRADLSVRVLPYIQDLAQVRRVDVPGKSTGATRGVFGPTLRSAAEGVERVLGGAASVERRLQRAGIEK
ncbi:MAG: pilus assembly protein TadB, partial [Nocardioides sp.]|nr:pilus assembly protein TadB [Nocardioides sp.]